AGSFPGATGSAPRAGRRRRSSSSTCLGGRLILARALTPAAGTVRIAAHAVSDDPRGRARAERQQADAAQLALREEGAGAAAQPERLSLVEPGARQPRAAA